MRPIDAMEKKRKSSNALVGRIARFVQPVKRFEDVFAFFFRNAGAVVFDDDVDEPFFAGKGNVDAFRIPFGIRQQIGDTAFKGVRTNGQNGVFTA